MRSTATACVALAAAVAGMQFAPVFGVPALLLPVGVPAAAVLLAALACAHRPHLAAWRPLLLAVAGLLAVTETSLWPTTAVGLPTGGTLRALAAGVTDSWQLTLQSTVPARPDPALLLFVPLLVVLAAVLGIELLHRPGGPLLALAPSLAVAILSQFFATSPRGPAAAWALAYAAVAGCLLAASGTDAGREPMSRPRTVAVLSHAAAPAVLALVGAVLAGLLLPTAPPRYSLRQDRSAALPESQVTNPLDEIVDRLTHPGTPVFRVRGAAAVDRWPLVVLDTFDGVNWTPGGAFRRLGAELRPGPAVNVRVRQRSAWIDVGDPGGPWLPSQTWPAKVRGVAPLVAERHGTLLRDGSGDAPTYQLTWWQPEIDPGALETAAIDQSAPGGLGGVGEVPDGVAELAGRAVRGMRPSFRAALLLERFFRENYRLAVGEDLPTGHGWPQLTRFLRDGRGTSEQFAAAYVALARILGIPARLAVGFRAPARPDPDGWATVRNGDVLAWPEVAVAGIGWVPLEPGDTGSTAGPVPDAGLAGVTAQVRARLPATHDLRDPPVAPQPRAGSARGDDGGAGPAPWSLVLGVPLLLALVWLLGVPAGKAGRAWLRRRRPGAGAVVGAWAEAHDRLRAHGVAVSAGMTVRDLAAAAAAALPGPRDASKSIVDALGRLGTTVDQVLWSGAAPGQQGGREAWAAVRAVRRGLARRGWRARLRAALDPRSLLPPRR